MLEAILSNQNQDTSETNDEIKALGMHIRCDRLSRRKEKKTLRKGDKGT